MVDQNPSVLIVDDEQVVCDLICDELSERGFLCTTALDGDEALTKLTTQDFDVVLLDIKLPGISGMEVLRNIQSNHHNTTTIMITAVNDVDTAVEAMKLGASDYIVKPFDLDRVNTSIRTVSETGQRLPERRDYKTPLYVEGEGEDRQAMEKSFGEMDAIARGVEAKLEQLVGHSKIVTEKTVEIAWQLGMPEEVIQRWGAVRARLDSERNRIIDSPLNKVKPSLFAESVMRVTKLLLEEPNLSESQD